jgi:hypothetical protein
MAYTVRSILGKTRLHRPDLREAEVDYLAQEIVRRICRLTMLAQKELTIDFAGPLAQFALIDPDGDNINRVHLVRYQDSIISHPSAPTAALTAGTGFTTGNRVLYTVVAVGGQGWMSKHSELGTVVTTSGNNQVIVTMPSIPNAPYGFDHFNLYRQVANSANDKVVTGISIASQAVITSASHGYAVGDYVVLFSVGGMTAINGKLLEITAVTTNTFTVDLDTTDSSKYSIYTSGGTITLVDMNSWNLCNTQFTNSLTVGVDTNNSYAGTVTISSVTYNYINFETSTSEINIIPTGDYRTLGEGNFVDINNSLAKPDSVFGTPQIWAYDADTNMIKVFPPTSEAIDSARFQITYSYIPVGEIDTIPLLPESEEAVYYGTLGEAYMLPGPGQNLELAKNYEIKFNFEMSNLKAVATQGNSGRLTVPARPLGGRRRKPFGAFGDPWGSSWGW